MTQNGDTTYTHHYYYDVSLSKGSVSNIACNASGYTPGTYATLTARRKPVYYWRFGGTASGEGSYSNVTANITGMNGAWTTATSSSSAGAVSSATGGSKLYLMGSSNVNTDVTRTVSMTATVTDSTGTGTKSATATWTQNGDEKVEPTNSDGKKERKYNFIFSPLMADVAAAGGSGRTKLNIATVTKTYVWKYGGNDAGSETTSVNDDSDSLWYNLYTSYNPNYTITMTRSGTTSSWTGGYLFEGDVFNVTATE